MENVYKYELSQQDVNHLLQALNSVQVRGVEQIQAVLGLIQKLQAPLNADEIGKKQLEGLKAKYEPKNKAVEKVVAETIEKAKASKK